MEVVTSRKTVTKDFYIYFAMQNRMLRILHIFFVFSNMHLTSAYVVKFLSLIFGLKRDFLKSVIYRRRLI